MFHYFKIPYFTCTFLQDLPTMNILDPIFNARYFTIFASEFPELWPVHHIMESQMAPERGLSLTYLVNNESLNIYGLNEICAH
jgi:hypothetical protein